MGDDAAESRLGEMCLSRADTSEPLAGNERKDQGEDSREHDGERLDPQGAPADQLAHVLLAHADQVERCRLGLAEQGEKGRQGIVG